MNELLTTLYRAARPKEALASQDEFKSANALLGSDVEKFANLIIVECIDAVKQIDMAHAHTTFDKDLVDSTVEKCVQSIKERFKE